MLDWAYSWITSLVLQMYVSNLTDKSIPAGCYTKEAISFESMTKSIQ